MNLKQHAFVNEYLYWNDATVAYKIAYKSKSSYKTLESAANRLLKNPEVAAAIERSISAVRSRVENEVAKRLTVELLSIQEKRVILAQIARGEMYIEQHYKGKNCSQCTQYIKPSFNIMLRALQEDSRLAGHYPDKRIHKHHPPLAGVVRDEPGVEHSHTAKNHNKTQQTNAVSSASQQKSQNEQIKSQHNNSPLGRGVGVGSRDVPTASPSTQNHNISQQKDHEVKNEKPLRLSTLAVKQKPLNTITHAGLRRLFAKNRRKNRNSG